MSYDKSDIRFELIVCENLLLVKKMQKIEIWRIFLRTNDLDLYRFWEENLNCGIRASSAPDQTSLYQYSYPHFLFFTY